MPEFIVVQSKESYDREQREKFRILIKALWWIFCSYLFSFIFQPFTESWGYIFLLFFGLFLFADLTKDRKLRAYIKATFAFFYGFWGVGFIVYGLLVISNGIDMSLIMIGIGALFFWLCYHNLKKYTRLLDRFFKR